MFFLTFHCFFARVKSPTCTTASLLGSNIQLAPPTKNACWKAKWLCLLWNQVFTRLSLEFWPVIQAMLLNHSVPLIWSSIDGTILYEDLGIFQLEQKKQRKEIRKCKSALLLKSRNQNCLLGKAHTWWRMHDNNHAYVFKA